MDPMRGLENVVAAYAATLRIRPHLTPLPLGEEALSCRAYFR